MPLPERYVHELLKIFSISPLSFRAFSLSFARRFGKTQCWRVALKCLLLLHRLLRSVPENSPFRSELLWTRSNGFFSLYPCHFHDDSSSASQDYMSFIITYARLLDEALDCFSIDCKVKDNEEVARLLEVLPQLQSLIDRVMDCRPTGSAARSFIVRLAMKHLIRGEIVMVLDKLLQMPYPNCITAFGIYKKAAVQADQLCEFYDWCRSKGLCGSYEYPFIDRIPQIQIRALESFLNGMWESSLPTESSSSIAESPSSLTEDDGNRQVARRDIVVVSTGCEKLKANAFPKNVEGDKEMEALIQLEDNENDNWQTLLEASVNLLRPPRNNFCYGYENNRNRDGDERNEWKMQVYIFWISLVMFQITVIRLQVILHILGDREVWQNLELD